MTVELAHAYRAELERDPELKAWRSRLVLDRAWARPDGDRVLLFVDDYPNAYTQEEREEIAYHLHGVAADCRVAVAAVAFESSCAQAADALAEVLPVDGGWLWKQGTGHWRATLIREEDEGAWTCPALSAIWTLARLGHEPYASAVWDDAVKFLREPYVDSDILTVLPTTYIDNEAAVVDMLRVMRKPRVPLSRVRYIFT